MSQVSTARDSHSQASGLPYKLNSRYILIIYQKVKELFYSETTN